MSALDGVRVVEFAGLGPGPFAGGLLADFGADVIRIDRPGPPSADPRFDFYNRNKRSVVLDLKSAGGREAAVDLIARADVVIEGYRPGVMARLGLGYDVCAARNPRLIYASMTGWGQTGPLAQEPGHDINYLALTGALHAIGAADRPPSPPLNLVADLGGGGMYLAFGIVAALLDAQRSGKGQYLDVAMVDGVSHLMSAFTAFRQQGTWTDQRGDNIVDGGSPDYGCYETSDGRYVAIGSIEPQFYDALLNELGLDQGQIPDRADRASWPELRALFASRFRQKTRAEWEAQMTGKGVCFAPVLTIPEAWAHPHMTARNLFPVMDGLRHPAPAPLMSRSAGSLRHGAPQPGADSSEILEDLTAAQ